MSDIFPPKDFVHLYQDRDFLRALFPNDLYTIVGDDGAIGRAYTFGPLQIEYYTTDREPNILPFRGMRIIFWNSITHTIPPYGWNVLPFKNILASYAYIDISDSNYWQRWSETFRRQRRLWDTQKEYEIHMLDEATYTSLYQQYGISSYCIYMTTKVLRKALALDTSNVRMYGLARKSDGVIVTGVATINSMTSEQSYYLSSFTRKDIAPSASGLWLLSSWMEEIRQCGLRYANLGVMWSEGMSTSWKGFSAFKAKFKPSILTFPKQFYKITFSLRKK